MRNTTQPALRARENGARARARVVVITGGSAGVGRASARAFAARGDRVAILARDPERLEQARRELEALGATALAIALDVADAAAVERAADRVEAELGPIDVWINNAMATVFARFEDITPEEFRRVTEVTYLGTVNGTRAALRRMKPRDRGVIVQVGSALAYRGIPLQSAYCGAKHAARGFTDSVRSELIHDESAIHVTMVHLPAINTPQFEWGANRMPRQAQPVPPIFDPEVAARAIVFAAQRRRRELYVGWPSLKTIVGNKLAPGYADRRAAHDAWDGQMTDEPREGSGAGNLFAPVPGPYAAEGRFAARSRSHSLELALSMYRVPLVLGLAIVGGAVAMGLARRRA